MPEPRPLPPTSATAHTPEEWLPIVYEELRRLARREIGKEADPQTLQTTALVHEAYLRLSGSRAGGLRNRAHFFGAAARAMRQILVDRARARKADKRGGGRQRVPIEFLDVARVDAEPERLLALDQALADLERKDARMAQIVLLRFFAGMTIEQTAEALEISKTTVKDEWNFARGWLYSKME